MPKTKYRRRIPPCPAYDIPGMESWLEDMAAKGYHLAQDGFSSVLARFTQGEPRQERFRLEPTATSSAKIVGEYEPAEQAANLNAELGWTYRARRGSYHIYSTANPDAPELHTDPQVQALTMEALEKQQRRLLASSLFWMVYHGIFWYGNVLISSAVVIGFLPVVAAVVVPFWNLYRDLSLLYRLGKLRKQLQQGIPLPHRSDYRRKQYQYLFGAAVQTVLLVYALWASLSLWYWNASGEGEIRLLGHSGSFPFATVEDYFPQGEVTLDSGSLDSYFQTWSNRIAPENYDYHQYATVSQNGQTFDVDLYVSYHRTCHPWVAQGFAEEITAQSRGELKERILERLFRMNPIVIQELNHPDWDYGVYYYQLPGCPYLILRKGDTVLKIGLSVWDDVGNLEPQTIAQIALSQLR